MKVAGAGDKGGRWLVGLGALVVAFLALYVLTIGQPPASSPDLDEQGMDAGPAMDEIDDESRAAMRELLREDETASR
jgi:hypothetical protein